MQDMEGLSLVWQHVIALLDSMVLKCSLKLRLFDAMHAHGGERGISLSDLAASLSVLPNRVFHLSRILRYLSHMRLVTIHREAPDTDEAEETYALTPVASAHFRDASENSLADMARYLANEEVLSALHMLDTCLVGEMLPIERARGETLFEWVERDPALNRTFHNAMTCTARLMAEAVVRGCPEVFEGVKSLVDVGGGRGIMASAVAKAFPNIDCVVYDLPHALAQQTPDNQGVAYQVGDMFVSLPRAEALLLMRVLHCWNDEKAVDILKRCREAIAEEKRKIIIVDTVMDENDSADVQHVKLGFDIWMMAYVGGKERTEKEWRSLLLQAGFTQCTFNRVMALETVIEARP